MMKNATMVMIGAMMMVMLMKGVFAETLTVGDEDGWSIPSDPEFYSSWAAKHTFVVGDTLVFDFEPGSHTVVKVTSKEAFDKCNSGLDPNAQLFPRGPAKIDLTDEGEVFFFCTVGSHCSSGQKLAIDVKAAGAKPPVGPTSSDLPDKGSAPTKPMGLVTLSTLALCLGAIVMALGY